jgi:hypothetical protein
MRIEAMADIEVQEGCTDHDGGAVSVVNVRVVATQSAATVVERSVHRPGRGGFIRYRLGSRRL